jgi:hypothetical protein
MIPICGPRESARGRIGRVEADMKTFGGVDLIVDLLKSTDQGCREAVNLRLGRLAASECLIESQASFS